LKPIVLAIALASLVPSAFAADNTSSRLYGTSEALSVQDARLGEVLMVRSVYLKSDKKINAGSAIGAAVGYGAASKVESNYRNAARVAGGVIGGVAGTAIQNGFSGRRAVEIYVRDLTDNRQRLIAIVQDADVDVRHGDQVFLVGKGNRTRVVPIRSRDAACSTSCHTGAH
jgi:outer membrane lipoprotein SlyB